jgi:hypothetical protein
MRNHPNFEKGKNNKRKNEKTFLPRTYQSEGKEEKHQNTIPRGLKRSIKYQSKN